MKNKWFKQVEMVHFGNVTKKNWKDVYNYLLNPLYNFQIFFWTEAGYFST